MTCNIKIGKKRTHNESLTTDMNKTTDSIENSDLKRKKIADINSN
jgi:hypothetical protein